ncbi:MAG: CsgG/HfaB family protein [Phycisphaerae bacterium]
MMKPRFNPIWRSILVGGLMALLAGSAMLAAPRRCLSDDEIQVAPPPPPPEKATEPAPTFDYKHEIKEVKRDRKAVVALLRTGDVVALKEYLPFGRGVGVSQTTDAKIKGQAGDETGDVDLDVEAKTDAVVKTGLEDAPVFMPPPIRQFLTRALLQTREFVVVERERILEIARELALAKTQAVDPKTAPRPGHLIGVHYIIEGAYFPAGALPRDDPALAPVQREIRKRRLAIDPTTAAVMYLTVYRVETGEIKAVACGADLQPLVAIERAVEDLLDQMRDVVEPIRVTSVNPQTGMAILDIGSDSGVKPGDAFLLGSAADETGALKAQAVEVKQLFSTVKIAEGDAETLREGMEARPEPEEAETTPVEKSPD